MVMVFMNILERLQKNKSITSMKNSLNGLFVDINAPTDEDSDSDFEDFDFSEMVKNSDKPFNACFYMHNQEFKHKNYSNKYDESLDLFIPSGDGLE